MSTKLKLPRRKLPWLATLLDELPYSKLPTNEVVLRRLYFEIEKNISVYQKKVDRNRSKNK